MSKEEQVRTERGDLVPEVLHNCPFCGSEARWANTDVDQDWEIQCSNVNCPVIFIGTDETGRELATAWNNRPELASCLGKQLEHDRSLVADCVTAASEAVKCRDWLTEGRGPYEWNDDNWHKEFAAAAREYLAAIEPMRKVAADWTGCPMKPEEVADARINWQARAADVKCSYDGCTTMIPCQEVIRCVDCRQALCDKHILTHFTAEDKRIRERLASVSSERDYLQARAEQAEAENKRLRKAILWADGQVDDFRARREGEGAYWWRRELMERAGLRALAGKESGQATGLEREDGK
jgi:hypothetical protein